MIKGGHIQSRASFLYGHFETMCKFGYGSGTMAGSFFLFNDVPGFQNAWAEIGFELLGKYTNTINTYFILTVDGKTDKNINVQQRVLNARASDQFWKLSIDWNADRIIWSINDIVIRTSVVSLRTPQKLMMNIWQSGDKNWSGEFNAGLLPQEAEYQYVQYTSPTGQIWIDSFQTIDTNRWQLADWAIEGTQMSKENVSIKLNPVGSRSAHNLVLKLTA